MISFYQVSSFSRSPPTLHFSLPFPSSPVSLLLLPPLFLPPSFHCLHPSHAASSFHICSLSLRIPSSLLFTTFPSSSLFPTFPPLVFSVSLYILLADFSLPSLHTPSIPSRPSPSPLSLPLSSFFYNFFHVTCIFILSLSLSPTLSQGRQT